MGIGRRNVEIERKYLVRDDSYKALATRSVRMKQAYLSIDDRSTVRLRITDRTAMLTIKGASLDGGLSRSEWEYQIPLQDAREMLPLSKSNVLDKVRYYVPYEGFTWEVDCFEGNYEGLTIAEIELVSTTDTPPLPSWVLREVTGDARYYNAALSIDSEMPPLE